MTPERNQQLTWMAAIFLVVSLGLIMRDARGHMPGNHQGYTPPQPIEFSHRLHAGELEVSCLYCHSGAPTSRHAGIPAASVCMNCHKFVPAPWDDIRSAAAAAEAAGQAPQPVVSPEINKIYRALGLGPDLEPLADAAPEPLAWVKVHNLPDFVYFNHAPHVAAEIDCAQCHGNVAAMERIGQESSLAMGWCLQCHQSAPHLTSVPERTPDLSDCAICHY